VLQSPPVAVVIGNVNRQVIPAVAALAQECALDKTTALNQGFLVGGYRTEDYLRFCNEAVDFIVAEDPNLGVAGFALTLSEDEGVHICQVAVSPRSKRRGIGRLLYEELLRRHPHEQVSAHIVREPMNIASIAFHEAQGFDFMAELAAEGHFRVGRWVRKPA
jgi:ribosomal protein S18 acetylase RimI-like enzyme